MILNALIGIVIVALLGPPVYNWVQKKRAERAASKGEGVAGAEGLFSGDLGSHFQKIAGLVFKGLAGLRKDLKLSPPGRALLVDGLVMYESAINMFPDSPQKTAALEGRLAMATLLLSAPVYAKDETPAELVKPVPKPEPAVT